jgi:hypothetical protein
MHFLCRFGFIVSNKAITMDPFKVEEIVQFPPLCTIHQLQSLQEKMNFLHRFITNYVEITNGFFHRISGLS